jgi:hypothetical protein
MVISLLNADLFQIVQPSYIGSRLKTIICQHNRLTNLCSLFVMSAVTALCMRVPDNTEFFVATRKIDWDTQVRLGELLPRYTQLGTRMKPYIGLHDNMDMARHHRKHCEEDPNDFYMLRITMHSSMFLHYCKTTTRDNTPCLYKALFVDGKEWHAWRFLGNLPLIVRDLRDNAVLLRVEPCPLTMETDSMTVSGSAH